jgi:hypothetical protein
MSRTTSTFSISLPPEMATEVERVRKEEHRTRSELVLCDGHPELCNLPETVREMGVGCGPASKGRKRGK